MELNQHNVEQNQGRMEQNQGGMEQNEYEIKFNIALTGLHTTNTLGILESSLARLMLRVAALSTRYPHESVAISNPTRKSGSVL